MESFSRFDDRSQHTHAAALARSRFCFFEDGRKALFLNRQIALWTKLRAEFSEQQTQKMIDLRDRRHG